MTGLTEQTSKMTRTNQNPVARNDGASVLTGRTVRIKVLANDFDPDNNYREALSVKARGTDTVSKRGGQIKIEGNTLVFTSAKDFVGKDTFKYTISDGRGGHDSATVSVNVLKIPLVDGRNFFEGSNRKDNIFGTGQADLIQGFRGNDVLNGLGGNDIIKGGDGEDNISGGKGNDTLRGGNDADFLKGEGGNDKLFGGNGRDALRGGDGSDSLYGGNEGDSLKGEGGNDKLFGGNGWDDLFGGDGNDTLYGGKDRDALYGENGNDVLCGQEDGDLLLGNGGNDTLYGGDGDDRLFGTYVSDNGKGEIDILNGGAGRDTFYLAVFYRSPSGTIAYVGEGDRDYALIKDFEIGKDTIRLTGSSDDYDFKGEKIFYKDDLIGTVEGVNVSDIPDSDIIF